MPTVSFDDYIREVEARATPAERALLDAARERAKSVFQQVEYKIEKRERIDAYVARLVTEYGAERVTLHVKPDNDPFDRDGPCVEVRMDDNMVFTTLLFQSEVWALHQDERVTKEPVRVNGHDDDDIIANIIAYINSFN